MSTFASTPWSQPVVARSAVSFARRFAPCIAAILMAAVAPTSARAEVEWHGDLETAQAAARISRRPVLAVFVASWSDAATTLESACLGSPEAEAVLDTCFEPVRIDIDEHESLTRAVGVTHVPTACVLAADDTVLTSFEMSGPPRAFVTAAILAARRAASIEQATIADDGHEQTVAQAAASESMTAAAFGSRDDAAAGPTKSPRGSMARVAAKVRDLSAFAMGQNRPAAAGVPATIAPASQQTVADAGSDYRPLAWPAEPAPPTPMAPTPPPTPTIEPQATALTPTTVAPWLDAPARQTAAAPPTPAPAPRTTTAPPEQAPAAQQTGLIATLQKPFGLGGKAAQEPPTMPPAQPQSPLAATTPITPPAGAQAAALPTAVPDTLGSMPVGLEGYCPVTLVDRGTWTEGRAQWGVRHRGRTYLFAGSEEQKTFLADPDRYAPALSGDDPVLALDRGSSTPGQRRYGVTYQSRIYLFATPETRTAFTADPARYTARVAVAERTSPAAGGTRTY